MASKAVFVLRGDYGNPEGHYSKCQVDSVTDDTAAATLQTALAAHTDCNVAKRSFLTLTLGTDAEPGADANVDVRGIIFFRNPTTLKVHRITLAAPVAADVELVDQGLRYTDTAVNAIVSAIATATGIAYTGLYGVVLQKR